MNLKLMIAAYFDKICKKKKKNKIIFKNFICENNQKLFLI